MPPPPSTTSPPTLQTLFTHLSPFPKTLLYPLPPHATSPSLNPQIAALQLHPTLEAALHILNADLPSAHFLLRKMQAPPAIEGMLLHGILHRCEGDYENARAWVGDVRDACQGWVPKRRGEERLGGDVWEGCQGGDGNGGRSLVEFVYGGREGGAEGLVGDVEVWRKGKGGNRSDEDVERELEERIREEMERVLEWCRGKFGDGTWVDASGAWVKDAEEVREMKRDMVSGDKGWREF